MKKSIKYIFAIITIVLAFATTTPVFADANTNATPNAISFETRQPYSKKELAMKFIIAMLGVAASSVIIYVSLSIYNKILYGNQKNVKVINETDHDFKTPTNMKDALNIFLKKTKN